MNQNHKVKSIGSGPHPVVVADRLPDSEPLPATVPGTTVETVDLPPAPGRPAPDDLWSIPHLRRLRHAVHELAQLVPREFRRRAGRAVHEERRAGWPFDRRSGRLLLPLPVVAGEFAQDRDERRDGRTGLRRGTHDHDDVPLEGLGQPHKVQT